MAAGRLDEPDDQLVGASGVSPDIGDVHDDSPTGEKVLELRPPPSAVSGRYDRRGGDRRGVHPGGAPILRVFAYAADPRTHSYRQPQLLRTELLSDGEIGIGTRAVEIRRMFGRQIWTPFEITRHEAPNRQDFHTTGGPIRPDGVLRCEQVGDATRHSYEFTFAGPLGGLLARMIRRRVGVMAT